MDKLAIFGGPPIRRKPLSYGRQSIDNEDIASVEAVLRSDYLTCGPATTSFQHALERVVGATHVVPVSSGTAALHVACLALGIKPGDEVIVSPITFAASANCVCYCGATPVFADIEGDTWNISPESISKKVTRRTRAVIAVDLGGVPVNLDEIRKLCIDHNLSLIEDAAHSLGSVYRGKPIGSIADITTFSFHPVKTITSGEGGAIATNDEGLALRAKLFARHGITRDPGLLNEPGVGGWHYEQLELGYNYRMSDIQAALGENQLKKLPDYAERRKSIVTYYNHAFGKIPEVRFQYDPNPSSTVRHLYCLRFDVEGLNTTRRFIFDALRAEGIGVNVHYQPVYQLPYYRNLGYDQNCCEEANRYYKQAVTLPLHYCMTDQDIDDVIKAVVKVVSYCRCCSHRA